MAHSGSSTEESHYDPIVRLRHLHSQISTAHRDPSQKLGVAKVEKMATDALKLLVEQRKALEGNLSEDTFETLERLVYSLSFLSNATGGDENSDLRAMLNIAVAEQGDSAPITTMTALPKTLTAPFVDIQVPSTGTRVTPDVQFLRPSFSGTDCEQPRSYVAGTANMSNWKSSAADLDEVGKAMYRIVGDAKW